MASLSNGALMKPELESLATYFFFNYGIRLIVIKSSLLFKLHVRSVPAPSTYNLHQYPCLIHLSSEFLMLRSYCAQMIPSNRSDHFHRPYSSNY